MTTDYSMHCENTWSASCTLKSNDVALDITGWTVYFTVKPSKTSTDEDDSSAIITKDITVHGDPTNGVTTITLSPSDTCVNPGKYYYDITVKKTDGTIKLIKEGFFTFNASCTKRANS